MINLILFKQLILPLSIITHNTMLFTPKNLAFITLAFILQYSTSMAQESDSSNPPLPGSHALQFQISNNFNLSSFSGSAFSYKRQLSDSKATRLGVSLNNRYNHLDYPDNDNNLKTSGLDLNFAVNFTWMTYTNPDAEIKFYYGYGPGVSLGYDKSKQEHTGRDRTYREFDFGLEGLGYAGVEWFFHPSMSLHAEYRSSIQIVYLHQKVTDVVNATDNKSSINGTSLRLGGDGVRFGLSVYF